MQPQTDKSHTVLSPEDVAAMQMVEGLVDTPENKLRKQEDAEFPDMSVGWYASPQGEASR